VKLYMATSTETLARPNFPTRFFKDSTQVSTEAPALGQQIRLRVGGGEQIKEIKQVTVLVFFGSS